MILALAATIAATAVGTSDGAELRYDPAIDGTVTAVAGAGWLTLDLLEKDLVPAQCRWCNPPAFDSSVRTALRWSNPAVAGTISDVLAYGGAPTVLLVTDYLVSGTELRPTAIDTLLIAESATSAGVVEEIVKAAAGRERPFVHALALAAKLQTANPADNNASFYSGHTSFVASVAAAAGTCASLRHRRRAWEVWVVGAVLTAATGYLRVAADQHYATDVLVGAAAGGAIGFAIPYFAHRPIDVGPATLSLVATSSGMALNGSF